MHIKFLILVLSFVEGICGIEIDECIESLIHPSKFTLVIAYNHGEPVVAKFVIRHAP